MKESSVGSSKPKFMFVTLLFDAKMWWVFAQFMSVNPESDRGDRLPISNVGGCVLIGIYAKFLCLMVGMELEHIYET